MTRGTNPELRLVQLNLRLLALLVRCRVVLPLNHCDMLLVMLGEECLVFDLGLDVFKILVERSIANGKL
jgi:hypothetical protein